MLKILWRYSLHTNNHGKKTPVTIWNGVIFSNVEVFILYVISFIVKSSNFETEVTESFKLWLKTRIIIMERLMTDRHILCLYAGSALLLNSSVPVKIYCNTQQCKTDATTR